jgi:hypothetical protein
VGGIVFGWLVRNGEAECLHIRHLQDTQSKPGMNRPGQRLRCSGQSREVYGNLAVWPTVKLEGIRSDGSVRIHVPWRGSKPSVQEIVVGYLDGWYRHFDRGPSDNIPDQL